MAVGVKAKLVLRLDAAMTEQEKRSFLVCILFLDCRRYIMYNKLIVALVYDAEACDNAVFVSLLSSVFSLDVCGRQRPMAIFSLITRECLIRV
jgi:hypothetical protein